MKKRKILLITLLAVLIPAAIGFGYKFFSWNGTDNTSKQAMTVDGGININKIADDVMLLPGDKICGEIQFNIKSTATSLLRVKVESFISDTKDGAKSGADVCKLEGIDGNWIDGNDGYYYYNQGVSTTKNATVPFVTEVLFEIPENQDANDYQGKYIGANVQAEMVQAKHGVFEQHWNISPNAKIYNTLKEISDNEGN